jgi:uncharacterized protein YciW
MGTVMVQIPVDEATAERLADPRRLAAVSELVMAVVRRPKDHDPLMALFEQTRQRAAAVGLTDEDIDAELALWKAERAAKPD